MILQGDCLTVMTQYPDNHFSSIVTDPPYGLKFMGKEWDHGVPGVEFWKQALRVSKPGAFLLAFGGTRTYHKLACAIEDAGWEIRDCLMWLYGSGFPKSLDITKAIDKRGGNPALVDEIAQAIKQARKERNLSFKECDDKYCGGSSNWSWFEGRPAGVRIPSDELMQKICEDWPELQEYFIKVQSLNREVIGSGFGGLTWNKPDDFTGKKFEITASCSDLAKKFTGYGTALKPAWEPIIMAMKPCNGTFAQNAEKWGQAGINIETSRIEGKRWPANLILDEESGAMLDEQSGINASRFFYCAKASPSERNEGCNGLTLKKCQTGCAGAMPIDDDGKERDRFKKEARNHHPTVKPLKLMKYLIKLVMPPKDGILLDPFAGSGSTIVAAKHLGYDAVGIELQEEYCEIARKRVESVQIDPQLTFI